MNLIAATRAEGGLVLAWLSSVTLKTFITGISSRILMLQKANLVYSLSRLRRNLEMKMTSTMIMTTKNKTTSKMRTASNMMTTSKMMTT